MNSRISVVLVVCPLLLLLPMAAPPPLAAQAPAVTLTANSPELYEAFFRFHEDFNRWSDQRKAANALEAPSLDAALARELKVDRADLGKLTAVTQSVMADLRKIDDDARVYLNARARYEQLPERAAMQQFTMRRQQAVQDGVSRLQKTLSGASWSGLSGYIIYIQKMKELGITSGCQSNQFCPESGITNLHLAIFVVRAWQIRSQGGVGPASSSPPYYCQAQTYYTPTCASLNYFPQETSAEYFDVNNYNWIQRAYELVGPAITPPSPLCSPGSFCPEASILRGQITFGLMYGIMGLPRNGTLADFENWPLIAPISNGTDCATTPFYADVIIPVSSTALYSMSNSVGAGRGSIYSPATVSATLDQDSTRLFTAPATQGMVQSPQFTANPGSSYYLNGHHVFAGCSTTTVDGAYTLRYTTQGVPLDVSVSNPVFATQEFLNDPSTLVDGPDGAVTVTSYLSYGNLVVHWNVPTGAATGEYKLYVLTASPRRFPVMSLYVLPYAAPDFTITAGSPSPASVAAGGSVTYTITLGRVNNFSGSVTLSCSGLPAGAACSFNPNPATLPGQTTSTLTVTTSGSTPTGTVTFTVTGTSSQLGGGTLVHSATATLALTGTPPSSTNLALGKSATQSGTLFSGTPDRAVDGNTDGLYQDNSVTHTDLVPYAWWQVDLGASAAIGSVVIWNRMDCCTDRLNDYWVFVSDTPFGDGDTPAALQGRAGTWSSHQTVTPNPSATIAVNAQGRYVRVQLSGTNYLNLAEVQVLGAVVAPAFNPPGGSYTAAQNVTLSSATSGASIRYTTDGSTPTSSVGTLYSGAVSVSSTTTIKAIAYKVGMADSGVSTAVYTYPTAYYLTTAVSPAGAGSISPSSGWYNSGTVVTITATPAAGYQFSSFTGVDSSNGSTGYVTMNGNRSVAATFALTGEGNPVPPTIITGPPSEGVQLILGRPPLATDPSFTTQQDLILDASNPASYSLPGATVNSGSLVFTVSSVDIRHTVTTRGFNYVVFNSAGTVSVNGLLQADGAGLAFVSSQPIRISRSITASGKDGQNGGGGQLIGLNGATANNGGAGGRGGDGGTGTSGSGGAGLGGGAGSGFTNCRGDFTCQNGTGNGSNGSGDVRSPGRPVWNWELINCPFGGSGAGGSNGTRGANAARDWPTGFYTAADPFGSANVGTSPQASGGGAGASGGCATWGYYPGTQTLQQVSSGGGGGGGAGGGGTVFFFTSGDLTIDPGVSITANDGNGGDGGPGTINANSSYKAGDGGGGGGGGAGGYIVLQGGTVTVTGSHLYADGGRGGAAGAAGGTSGSLLRRAETGV